MNGWLWMLSTQFISILCFVKLTSVAAVCSVNRIMNVWLWMLSTPCLIHCVYIFLLTCGNIDWLIDWTHSSLTLRHPCSELKRQTLAVWRMVPVSDARSYVLGEVTNTYLFVTHNTRATYPEPNTTTQTLKRFKRTPTKHNMLIFWVTLLYQHTDDT